MNSEEVIRMAAESGIEANEAPKAVKALGHSVPLLWLERFAGLVAAAEREACAKACDDAAMGFGDETEWAQGYVQGIQDVADGIRARGNQ